jgi:hypothetical protein
MNKGENYAEFVALYKQYKALTAEMLGETNP